MESKSAKDEGESGVDGIGIEAEDTHSLAAERLLGGCREGGVVDGCLLNGAAVGRGSVNDG